MVLKSRNSIFKKKKNIVSRMCIVIEIHLEGDSMTLLVD